MDQSKIYQMTHPAPIVFIHVVTPRAERKVGATVFKAGYETTFLFTADHPDWESIRKVLRANAPEGVAQPHFPITSGDDVANEAKAKNKDREWARGKILFQAKSNVAKLTGEPLMPPRLVALLNGKYVNYGTSEAPRELAAKFFYSGVLAVGTFAFSGYTGMGGGVAAYLNEVLSLNSGDRIAGGPDAEEKYGNPENFSQYIGHVSAIDPTAGLTGLV